MSDRQFACAVHLRRGQSALSKYEKKIPGIDKKAGGLAKYKHRVFAVDGINQQGGAPGQTKVPKSDGDGTSFLPFALDPLDKESHGEKALAYESDNQPYVDFKHFYHPFYL
jgi:hypothetical protein